MPNYFLRVQLSIEERRYYTTLRKKLEAIGYTKLIVDKEGVSWRLPNGNYYVKSTRTIESVLSVTKPIVLSVDTKAQVVLVEAPKGGLMWFGLQKA